MQASAQRQSDVNAQEAASKASALQSNTIRDIAADSLAGNAVKRSEMEKRVFAKPEEANVPALGAKKRPRTSTEDSGDSGSVHFWFWVKRVTLYEARETF